MNETSKNLNRIFKNQKQKAQKQISMKFFTRKIMK